MPYITEEIWQKIPHVKRDNEAIKESIMISEYPKSLQRDIQVEEEMSYIIDAVLGIRTIRGELNVPPSAKLNVFIKCYSYKTEEILKKNVQYIKKLSNSEDISIGIDIIKPEGSATCIKSSMEIYVMLKEVLNIDSEVSRLKKAEKEIEDSINFLKRKLLNEEFIKKAPKEVVEKERAKYEDLLIKKEKILESIEKLREVGGKK
jgi:valyl-tRNA synthetase